MLSGQIARYQTPTQDRIMRYTLLLRLSHSNRSLYRVSAPSFSEGAEPVNTQITRREQCKYKLSER